MGRLFLQDLEGEIYRCKHCHIHLAKLDDLISICAYQGRGFYHCSDVVNVYFGLKEDRHPEISGLCTEADIMCNSCDRVLGWQFEVVRRPFEKYTKGKFILQREQLEQFHVPTDMDKNSIEELDSENSSSGASS